MRKKITIIALTMALPVAMFAQSAKPINGSFVDRFGTLPENLSGSGDMVHSESQSNGLRGGGSAIWEETFNNGVNTAGDTVYTDQGGWVRGIGDGAIWKYSSTGTNGCWSGNTPALGFATASNGFLMFDADSANCVDPNSNPPVFNQDILFGTIESPIIDLSSSASVALNFAYATRWCCADQVITVALSSDGGGTWSDELPILSPDVNINVQDEFDQNVSSLVGGSSTVKIRFTWSAVSHYYLAIDDIKFVIPPSDDIRMNYALISHNGTSEEYGRVPVDQLLPTITIGAEVYNFGGTDQTNDSLFVDFTLGGAYAFSGEDAVAVISSLDTVQLIDTPDATGLTPGVYMGTFVVKSDNDTVGGATFGNNSAQRNFAVTESLYSIDGIGVHAQSQTQTTSLGTNSFTGAEDGFMMLTYYDITSTTTAIGLEILLATGTEAGGSLVVTLHDTADIFQDDVTLFFAESEPFDITQQHINSGTIQVLFEEPVELQPNSYYAGVQMFSNGGDNIIRIVDDVTVPQPAYSSMIYIPNDQVYSNGNAAAIRLIAGPTLSIGEGHLVEADLTVYPNPTSGNTIDLVMRSSFNEKVNWELIDVTGAVVNTGAFATTTGKNIETIDLKGVSSGVYLVSVASNNYRGIERVVVEK